MVDDNGRDVEYREADDINETHANMFQVSPAGELVALYFGEQQFELKSSGESQPTEVLYDTKVKLTVESATALRNLLDEVLGDPDESQEHSPGVQ